MKNGVKRIPEGMHSITSHLTVRGAAKAIDFYKQDMLPAIEGFDGFCSASLMVDPTAARAVASVIYDSLGAMERSADATDSLRTAMLSDYGLDQDDVGEFELAIAHLSVPRQD